MKYNSKTAKQYKQLRCSPYANKKKTLKHSCLTPDALLRLKSSHNSLGKQKIETNNPAEIHISLVKYTDCEDDVCLLEKNGEAKQKTHLLSPFAPKKWKKNPNEWLSNHDIRDVLSQYEEAYPEFRSFDPSPIDYDTVLNDGQCVSNELCNFSLKTYLADGVTKIGIVFNLDTHNLGGSHWVSMFVDFSGGTKGYILFFDSTGDRIPKQLMKLKDEIVRQGKYEGIDFVFYKSAVEHQKENTECGMYSLFFIITMLSGKIEGEERSMDFIERMHFFGIKEKYKSRTKRARKIKRISDKYVEQYRKIYFNL